MKPVATIAKLMAGIPLKWVALGDSLTYGWMVKKGYLDFLNDMIIKNTQRQNLTSTTEAFPEILPMED